MLIFCNFLRFFLSPVFSQFSFFFFFFLINLFKYKFVDLIVRFLL